MTANTNAMLRTTTAWKSPGIWKETVPGSGTRVTAPARADAGCWKEEELSRPEMNETGKTHDPLVRLVLFVVCLAIFGCIVAGAHYYVVDLPQQKNTPAPENAVPINAGCKICQSNCNGVKDEYNCLTECDLICWKGMYSSTKYQVKEHNRKK
jgi:hypothetical protein